MNFLNIWWEMSQFATADLQVNRQSHLGPDSPPSLSVTEDGDISFLSTTFLLPLTVGLSTVVASVLLGCRNRSCIDTKKTVRTTTTLYPSQHLQSSSTLTWSSSSSGKRKSGKPNPHLSGPPPGQVFYQNLEQHERAPLYKDTTSSPPIPTIQRPPPSPVDDQSSCSHQQQPSAVKKPKKRSTKPRHHSSAVLSFVDDAIMGSAVAEVDARDESWVTVTPKRAFKPIAHQPAKHGRPDDERTSPTVQSNRTEGLTTKPIVRTSTTRETPLSVCTSLHSSSTTSSCTTSPSYPSDSTSRLRLKTVDNQQGPSQKLVPNAATTTTSPSDKTRSAILDKTSVTSFSAPLPRLHVVGTSSTGISELDHLTIVSTTSHEATETPGLTSLANVLHSQHLPAQLQAKELECQVLREEVIHLRDEIKSVRLSAAAVALPRCSPSAALHDVETMTTAAPDDRGDHLLCPAAVELVHDTRIHVSPSPTLTTMSPSTPAAQSASSSEVLVVTMQAEIKRLAKEITLSHQRNENLEFRLSTATKQLAQVSTKTVPIDTLDAVKQELANQVELTQTAETGCAEIAQRLADLQHLMETKSGLVMQWENSCAELMKKLQAKDSDSAALFATSKQLEHDKQCVLEDNDRLRQDYETLVVKHKEWDQSHGDLLETLQRLEASNATLASNNEQLQRSNTTLLESQEHLRHDYECLLAKYKVVETELQRVEELLAELRQNCLSTCARHMNTVDEHTRITEELNRRVAGSRDQVSELTQETSRLNELLTARQLEADELRRSLAECSSGEPAPMLNVQTSVEPDDLEPIKSSQSTSPAPLVDVVIGQLTVSQLTAAEFTTEVDADGPEKKDVEQQYHQALDCTEAMLTRLQASVDEEQECWRKALDASIAECQLLTTKVDHLEASLTTVMEERDTLAKSLPQQLQTRSVCSEAADDDRHSIRSTSVYSSISMPRFALDSVAAGTDLSPDTPRDELIAHIGKLRHLVRIEHNALKREQSKSAHLEAELKTGFASGSLTHQNGASLNGGAVDMTVKSEPKTCSGLRAEDSSLLPINGTAITDLETTKACGDVVDGLLPCALAETTSDLHPTETAI